MRVNVGNSQYRFYDTKDFARLPLGENPETYESKSNLELIIVKRGKEEIRLTGEPEEDWLKDLNLNLYNKGNAYFNEMRKLIFDEKSKEIVDNLKDIEKEFDIFNSPKNLPRE